MSLRTDDLRNLLAGSGADLSLPTHLFEIDAVEQLFDAYGSGDVLSISEAVYDLPGLAVHGRGVLAGQERQMHVRFLTDTSEDVVTGLEAVCEGFDWVIEEPAQAAGDFGFLGDAGFDAALVVVSAGFDVIGLTCGDGSAYNAQPGARFTIATAEGPSTSFVRVLVPSVLQHFNLLASLPHGVALASVESLASLPFLDGLPVADLDVPGPIEDVLAGLLLKQVSAAYATDTSAIDRAAVVLGVGPTTPWAVIEGFLTLESVDDLALRAVREEGTWLFAADMGATLIVAGYELHAVLALPGQTLTATLVEPDRRTDLIEEHLDGSGIDKNSLTVQYLNVDYDIQSSSYALSLGLDTTWTFLDRMVIRDLELRLSGQGGRVVRDACLTGTLAVGNSTIRVQGRKSGQAWGLWASAAEVDLSAFDGWFQDLFGIQVPDLIKDFELDLIRIGFDSAASGSVEFSGRVPMFGLSMDFTVRAEIRGTGPAREVTFGARLVADVVLDDGDPYRMVFDVDFASGAVGKNFTALWTAEGRPVPLFSILDALGLSGAEELQQVLPRAMCPEVSGVALAYDWTAERMAATFTTVSTTVTLASLKGSAAAGPGVWAVQVMAAVNAGVSDLPLVGSALPESADLRLNRVGLLYCSGLLSAVQVAGLNAAVAAIAPGAPQFPVLPAGQGGPAGGGLNKGAVLVVDYVLPGNSIGVLTVPVGAAGRGFSGDVGLPAPAWGAGVVPGSGAGGPSSGAWVDLGLSLGPLRVARMGLVFEAGVVWVCFDATLGAAGLTLGVQGLALGVGLNGDTPQVQRPRLDGLSVDFSRPPLRIGGSLTDRKTSLPEGVERSVEGGLVVSTSRISVEVIGAYQKTVDGVTSFFVYGELRGLQLGPTPFRVTGLALGFGFNSSLRIPEQDEVPGFPLVQVAAPALPGAPPGKSLMEMLAELTGGSPPWVGPRQDSLWFAAGVSFSSFEFINGRLLLVVEAGDEVTIALLGQAAARFPFHPDKKAYAQVRLVLRAVYRVTRGELVATAVLVDSYVIDPACALTGGFAVAAWFGPHPRSGDFVYTAGGYHPDFEAPSGYPQVPRLGMSWSLGNVSVKGTAYFALTSCAVMAGGTLEVDYRAGNLHAWLTAYAHALVQWAPLMFDIRVGVTIGAQLDLWLVKPRGELSASLHLWGPPTGGKITAKFVFVKVSFSFGKGQPSADPLGWDRFAAELLPDTDRLELSATHGLLAGHQAPAARSDEPWLASMAGFTFTVRTVVPVNKVAFVGGEPVRGVRDAQLTVRPLGPEGGKATDSALTVKVFRNTAARGAPARWQRITDAPAWQTEAINDGTPSALWGDPAVDEALDLPVTLDRTVGLTVVVPAPARGATIGAIREEDLAFEDLDLPPVVLPLSPDAGPSGPSADTGAAGAGVTAVTGIRGALRHLLRNSLARGWSDPETPAPLDGQLVFYQLLVNKVGLEADPLLPVEASGVGR
ncbi:hypothetical protein ABIA35_006605 [Catenulispora sp. MAP12-49]|uniref:DUF6603 domain-containing protein n=1 Tax=Catenulispora sp. MAP12-49 TaxID=3156302 RepID=UPI003517C8D5